VSVLSLKGGDAFSIYFDSLDPEMVSEQLRIEQEIMERGIDSYYRNLESARQREQENSTSFGTALMKRFNAVVADRIEEFLRSLDTGKPGKRHASAKHLRKINPRKAAYLALLGCVAGIRSTRHLTSVASVVGRMVDDEMRLEELREKDAKEAGKLVKNATERVSHQFRRTFVHRHLKGVVDELPAHERVHIGLALIDFVIETTGLFHVQAARGRKGKTYNELLPTQAALDWIDRRNAATEALRPQHEPMVVPPMPWSPEEFGGYLTYAKRPYPLVKTRNQGFLAELPNYEMPVIYEAINNVQNTGWQVNNRVLEVMNSMWDEDIAEAGLPHRGGVPIPPKPADIASNEESRRSWRRRAAVAWAANKSLSGERIATNLMLGTANRFAKYPAIYFPYQYDYRGRLYSVPSGLSPQGADPAKGLLRFAEGKPLGERGAFWLAYQGANLAGNDKVTFEERVQWVWDNDEAIRACAADPMNNRGWCRAIGEIAIDSPWQFLAFCFEWNDYRADPDGFVSHLSVAMDGSCSGIQHFSAMLRDPSGARAVNLTPEERPQDVYRIVADAVSAELRRDLEHGTEDSLSHTKDGAAVVIQGTKTLAAQWLEFGVTRKVTKRPVMTLAYGSKEYGFTDQLLDDILDPALAHATGPDGSIDKDLYPFTGDKNATARYLAKKIWASVTETLVAATSAMKWLQSVANRVAKENIPARWENAVGFPVMQAYPDMRTRRVTTSLHGGLTLPLLEPSKDGGLNVRKMEDGIAPNFVHSCDAAHLTLTVVRGEESGVTSFAVVHDSFGTHACDMDVYFKAVREAFVEIYGGINVLGNFQDSMAELVAPEVAAKFPPIPPVGSLDLEAVKASRYCFA